MSSFLVTGANGFVGRAMCIELLHAGHRVRGAIRRNVPLENGVEPIIVGDINGETDWGKALLGVDTVLHLASHVHVMQKTKAQTRDRFQQVNVDGTRQLAIAAARGGVKRLVFVSSIGVNGLYTRGAEKFSEDDTPSPRSEYAISKLEAERVLRLVGMETGLEEVVVRPPMVYGRGAPGNFSHLIRVLKSGVPLPFASVQNLRDFIYVKNLAHALLLCATHPKASGQIYLVSDGEAISTPALLKALGGVMNRPVRLLRCTPSTLRLLGKITGKTQQVDRLLNSLQVDSGKIRQDLGWTPPFTLVRGLQDSFLTAL